MYSICLRYCKDCSSASDALQMGFIKIFKNIHKFRNDGSLGGWIRRIIINESLGILRIAKSKFTHDLEAVNDIDMSVEIDLDFDDFNYKRMINLINQMPDGYRAVFSMAVLDNLSHREIGEILNITENTSRSQLLRARKMMQEKILSDNYLVSEYHDRIKNK